MPHTVIRFGTCLSLMNLAVMASPVAVAFGRDPGRPDVRGRRAVPRLSPSPSRAVFNPAAVNTNDRYGPRAGAGGARLPERRPRLYERVEADIDRGTGRIEDEPTYQLRRLRDDRDERLGRVARRREAQRFEEEYDRRRRIEQRGQRHAERTRKPDGAGTGGSPPRPPTAIDQMPAPGGSTLARYVAEEEARLSVARERYQRDLAQAEADRDAATAAAGTRQARAAAHQRFNARRSALTRGYQEYRRKVLGGAGTGQ